MNDKTTESGLSAYLLPSDAESVETVGHLVQEAARNTGFTMVRPDSYFTYDLAYYNHEPLIASCSVVIANLEILDLGLMAHLGYARGIGKPIVYISSDIRHVTSDYRAEKIIAYDLTKPEVFVEELTKTLKLIVDSPTKYASAGTASTKPQKPQIFISYSHKDKSFLDRLLVHLKPLDRDKMIDLWVDTRLKPGDRWKKEIEQALSGATIAILLVSADFLSSDFIVNNELPMLLAKAEKQGTRILPIVLKPCRFARHGSLKEFQAINDPAEPLIAMNEGESESYFDLVAQECERLAKVR